MVDGVRRAHERELERVWQVAGLREKTIRTRIDLYRRAGGEEATRDSVEELLSRLRHPATRAQYLTQLRCTYRELLERELLERDPTLGVRPPRKPRQVPRPLDRREVDLLLAEAVEPVRSWVTVAMFAGLRASEVARLRGDHLELLEGGWTLRVVGKGDHVGLVPAHARVVEVLEDAGPGRLWPITAGWVSQRTRREFGRLGIVGGIHRCRHTFATRALAVSGDLMVVRDLMRHASVATTQLYTQLADERPRAVVDLIR